MGKANKDAPYDLNVGFRYMSLMDKVKRCLYTYLCDEDPRIHTNRNHFKIKTNCRKNRASRFGGSKQFLLATSAAQQLHP